MKTKKREDYLDFIAGVMLLWMIVYAHYSIVTKFPVPYREQLGYALHLFMAWFFYKAGMFHKKEDIKCIWKKSFARLMIPFFVFTIIALVFNSIDIIINDRGSLYELCVKPVVQIILLGSTSANGPLWFLISLFAVRIIVRWLDTKSQGYTIVVILLSLSIPYLFYLKGIGKFIYIPNTLNGLIFYLAGYKLKDLQFSWKLFITAVIAYIIISILDPAFGDVRRNIMYKGNYYVWYLYCICGIIVINNLAKRLHFRDYIFTYLGRNSMTFYVMHWFFLYIAHILVVNISGINEPSAYFWTTMALCFTICPLLNHFLKKSKYSYIIGNTKK